MDREGPSFDEYLAGGFLANAPMLFFTYAVKSLLLENTVQTWLEIFSTLVVILGGAVAGYLVARRSRQNHIRVGLKTGLSAFLVNFGLSSILFEGTSVVYGLWMLLLFCSASTIGAFVRKHIPAPPAD